VEIMVRAAQVIKYVAFGLMAAFVTLGSLFIAGYAFDDPGGWTAVGMTAAWLVPLLGLTFVAYKWPTAAVWVLVGALVLLVGTYGWYSLDTEWWRDLMDESGPVLGISAFALGLPMAVLGLRRPLSAGLLLVAAAVIPYVGFLSSVSDEPWRGLAASLTTSSTIACVPVFGTGLLFLLSALLGRLGKPTPATPPPDGPQAPMSVGAPGGGSQA
jgi:hypothetical protein